MWADFICFLWTSDAIEQDQVFFVKSKCDTDDKMDILFEILAQREDGGK